MEPGRSSVCVIEPPLVADPLDHHPLAIAVEHFHRILALVEVGRRAKLVAAYRVREDGESVLFAVDVHLHRFAQHDLSADIEGLDPVKNLHC